MYKRGGAALAGILAPCSSLLFSFPASHFMVIKRFGAHCSSSQQAKWYKTSRHEARHLAGQLAVAGKPLQNSCPKHCCKSAIKCSDSRLREAAGDSSELPLAPPAEVWTGTSSRMCLLKGYKRVKPGSQLIVSVPERTTSAFVRQHRLREKKSASSSWASCWKPPPARHSLWCHDPCWGGTFLSKLGSSSFSAFSSSCFSWLLILGVPPARCQSQPSSPSPSSQSADTGSASLLLTVIHLIPIYKIFLKFNLNLDISYLKRKHCTAKQLKVVQDHFHTEAGPGYGSSPGWSRLFLIFGYWPQGEGIDCSEIWAGDFTHFPSLCNDVGCWARLGTCVPHAPRLHRLQVCGLFVILPALLLLWQLLAPFLPGVCCSGLASFWKEHGSTSG